jgi:hypothetical protein
MIARRQAPTTVANASGHVPAHIDDFTRDWPTDQVERRSVSSLVPYARDARTQSEAQVAQLAANIREWG